MRLIGGKVTNTTTNQAAMNDDDILLIEMPEHGSISVCLYNEHDDIFEMGERINEQFEEAYMNGYNWDAVIRFYIGNVEPELLKDIDTDPEAGMFSAHCKHSAENLEKMRRFETHMRTLLSDEPALIQLIADNRAAIEWD